MSRKTAATNPRVSGNSRNEPGQAEAQSIPVELDRQCDVHGRGEDRRRRCGEGALQGRRVPGSQQATQGSRSSPRPHDGRGSPEEPSPGTAAGCCPSAAARIRPGADRLPARAVPGRWAVAHVYPAEPPVCPPGPPAVPRGRQPGSRPPCGRPRCARQRRSGLRPGLGRTGSAARPRRRTEPRRKGGVRPRPRSGATPQERSCAHSAVASQHHRHSTLYAAPRVPT